MQDSKKVIFGIHFWDDLVENEQKPPLDMIASDVIIYKLPDHLRAKFGIEVNTRILSFRKGSLFIFFEVLLFGYNLISNISGFLNSVQIIQEECRKLLNMRLGNDFVFDIVLLDVEPENLKSLEDRSQITRRYKEKYLNGPLVFQPNKRDSLFYFSLILNIILFIIIVLLVYGAVVETYFS